MKPLGVTMGCRDFTVTRFWRDKIDFIDRLEIENYIHEEAHQIARDFFLSHPEYTHFVFICEDVLITPDMVARLLDDIAETDFPVISGYCNIGFENDRVNVTQRDLRKTAVFTQEQYGFLSLKQFLRYDIGNPYVRVFFQGNTLTAIRRDVVEKLSFKPYRRVSDAFRIKAFGSVGRNFGIMFDLQMAVELANLDIPVYVDTRLLCLHFGMTTDLINLKGKKRRVRFIKAFTHKEEETIREDEPYF
jgi:hypothetical protein